MPWALVAVIVAIVLGIGTYVTLYLPVATPDANHVQLGDLSLTLQAHPHTDPNGIVVPAGGRLVDLELTLAGPVAEVQGVDFGTDMPSMSHEAGVIQSVVKMAPDHYIATASLDMGGSWRVQVIVHWNHGTSDTASFDVHV